MKTAFYILLLLILPSRILAQTTAPSFLVVLTSDKSALSRDWLVSNGNNVRKVFSNPDIYEVAQ